MHQGCELHGRGPASSHFHTHTPRRLKERRPPRDPGAMALPAQSKVEKVGQQECRTATRSITLLFSITLHLRNRARFGESTVAAVVAAVGVAVAVALAVLLVLLQLLL